MDVAFRNHSGATYLEGMGRYLDKIDAWLARTGWKQVALERRAGLPANRIAKWRDVGEPTISQGLRIARVMGVGLDFLADDEMDEPPVSTALLDDEETALEFYRDVRAELGKKLAMKHMAILAAMAADMGEKARHVAHQDLTSTPVDTGPRPARHVRGKPHGPVPPRPAKKKEG